MKKKKEYIDIIKTESKDSNINQYKIYGTFSSLSKQTLLCLLSRIKMPHSSL
jgi:hypothetical protein